MKMQELKLEIIDGTPTVNILIEMGVVGSVTLNNETNDFEDDVTIKIQRGHAAELDLTQIAHDALQLIDTHNSTPNNPENSVVDFDYDYIVENLTWVEDSGNYSRYLDETTNDCDWVCHVCESVLECDPIEHVCGK